MINSGLGVLGQNVDNRRVRDSILLALDEARRFCLNCNVDLLVLDEINNALHRDLIRLEELWDFLATRTPDMEVVLTGRNAPEELLEQADLVTSMECLRHPLQNGVTARQGIEY